MAAQLQCRATDLPNSQEPKSAGGLSQAAGNRGVYAVLVGCCLLAVARVLVLRSR